MHFRTLEVWRRAAALTVMMWHFLRYAPPGHEAASVALYRLMPLMEMFFMILGLPDHAALCRHADGRARLVPPLHRARLYPLYLVTLLFFCVVAAACISAWCRPSSPSVCLDGAAGQSDAGPGLGGGGTDNLTFNYVSWTLSAEWFCYLALPVIVLAYRRQGMWGLAVVAASAVTVLELR